MKMGTIASLWRYDGALEFANGYLGGAPCPAAMAVQRVHRVGGGTR